MINWMRFLPAAQAGGGGPSGWDGHMMYSPFGGFSMILILGVLVVFVVLALRRGDGGREETPLAILKRRYAKGEIDKEEFERMKRELGE
ncbi:MAG: SHOCT domain-containing protein [Pseudodesulfovibrio sp.]|uniref:Membrane protein n=1 Tax=Pseudodesulfovibrio indicus TaxID=1716143 RepID=A0A126QSG8_9BACT|nr:SHOCT domain-containing protein [Pseudodesulfovibrio indicus]AMK12699.1 hypothetical protein AWY79_17095 [Pseudodesulfovibrio indicus]TDT86825.1 putative membrane protein [Pseudodesulfovibrio indicus]